MNIPACCVFFCHDEAGSDFSSKKSGCDRLLGRENSNDILNCAEMIFCDKLSSLNQDPLIHLFSRGMIWIIGRTQKFYQLYTFTFARSRRELKWKKKCLSWYIFSNSSQDMLEGVLQQTYDNRTLHEGGKVKDLGTSAVAHRCPRYFQPFGDAMGQSWEQNVFAIVALVIKSSTFGAVANFSGF